jgi:hypothetical protein
VAWVRFGNSVSQCWPMTDYCKHFFNRVECVKSAVLTIDENPSFCVKSE